jgi:hypothetical protein
MARSPVTRSVFNAIGVSRETRARDKVFAIRLRSLTRLMRRCRGRLAKGAALARRKNKMRAFAA